MKKIVFLFSFVVALSVLLYACRPDEAAEPQNPKMDQLAEQLAQDEDFGRLQSLFDEDAKLRLLAMSKLTKKQRQEVLQISNERAVNSKSYRQSPVFEVYLKETKEDHYNSAISEQLYKVKSKSFFRSLDRAERFNLYATALKLFRSKTIANKRAEDTGTCATDFQINYDACHLDYIEGDEGCDSQYEFNSTAWKDCQTTNTNERTSCTNNASAGQAVCIDSQQ